MKKWTRRAFIGAGVLAGGAAVFGVAIRPGNRARKVKDLVAEKDETLINIWLKIGADNVITAIVPHAEMGQGVHTALAMMLADELDADWQMIRIEEAPANKEYASGGVIRGFAGATGDFPALMQDTMNGLFNTIARVMSMELTGGSASVRFTGKFIMRVAGAAAKQMIKQAAAKEWKVPVEEISTSMSRVSHQKTGQTETYAHFAAEAAQMDMPVQPVLKDPSEFTIMGADIQRNDIPAKVKGTAQYGMDVKLPDMKYVTIKSVPVFGNAILRVDKSKLQKRGAYQKVIHNDKAVAVVADGYWLAKKSLEDLQIEYEKNEKNELSTATIFANFSTDLDEGNGLKKDHYIGDAEKVFDEGGEVIEGEYRVPFLAHTAMEPMNCTVWLQEQKCEVWIGCQNPLGIQKAVAKIVNLDKEDVHVYNQYLGGGFGRKSETDVAEQAAKIALEVPFPVKLIWSREEDVQQDKFREASISRFKAVLDSDGGIRAWQNRYTFKHHPPEASLPPYTIANQDIAHLTPETHIPWGNWRSVDHSKHGFFVESFVDELAHAAGKDPVAFRMDLLKENPRMQKVLAMAAEKANWGSPLEEGKGRGVSIVESFGSIVAEVAEVSINQEGKVAVDKVICVADAGYVVHPDAFIAQMESGIIFGLTAALYGEINIENGAVKESNFHDYQMLRMNEAPKIDTYIINSGEAMGGAGEPSTPGIAPAVCNAIFAATGTRIRELPIRNVVEVF